MVTIKDIAMEAGVSIGTVSRAINGEKGMRKDTREKILAISRQLNYLPNLQARGLVANQPNAIGIVIPKSTEVALSNPYYTEILKGIEERAKQSGLYLVLSFAHDESFVGMYQQRLAAGIIVVANRIDDRWIDEVYRAKVPLVLIPGDPSRKRIPSVDQDNVDGSVQAVRHLVALGHKRIAFINGPLDSKYSIDRLLGFRRAMEKYRLPIEKDVAINSDFGQQGGYENMKSLLLRKNRPTAVLMINDYSAIGALRAAKEMGFRVPEDLSIIGSGDIRFASMVEPALTTVKAPYREQGQKAVETLLQVMRGKRVSQRHHVLPVELVIRNSTSRCLAR